MCGIAGIMGINYSPNEEIIRRMTDAIAHRGPDGEGIWINELKKIGLGHRRLAIIDLSTNGVQPMQYQDKYVITFNGEIYNYLELKEDLKNKGYQFQSQSDTEVIMAAYDCWGVDCLTQFDGMFAFALYNKTNDELFCARDRFGEKPFFYQLDANKLMFASEMKALWAGGADKSVNNQTVYLYLNFSLHENPFNASQTFFNSINKLQAGHYFKYKPGQNIIQKQYWKIDLSYKNLDITFEAACLKFNELFFTSVNRRLRSDVQVGTSLSGGIDSSSVVLAIDQIFESKKEIQKTFSARFDEPEFDEGNFMSKVIHEKNIEHYCTYPNNLQMIEELPKIMFHQEEPFSTASIYVQWEVFKLAKKENVIVLLDGQGADEYLGGYTHFFIPYFREKYLQGGKTLLQKAINEMKENNILIDNIVLDKFFKMETLLPELFNTIRVVKHRLWGVPLEQSIHKNISNKYGNQKAPFENFVTLNQALYHSTFNSGLEKLLRFSDRNAMAFSREVRLPFLSHDLVEFVFSLPTDYKIRNGWTKAILRNSLKEILPPEIAWRKNKLGFQPPEKKWLNEKKWRDWSNDYHNISVQKKWLNNGSNPSWKSTNLGIFEEMLRSNNAKNT
jgi:asparagine synthase (glutamine-hydrolysing)